MSVVLRVMMVVLVAFVVSAPASAKDKDKDKGKGKDQIELTGIEAFDDVFVRVGEIDKRLGKADGELRDAKNNLNSALGLSKGTALSEGLSELKARAGDKLQLSVERQSVPKLQVTDAVPTNVQNAVDAVNQMTTNFSVSIDEITGLVPEIEKLAKQTTKMPSKLKDEFKKDGAGWLDLLFKLPKVSKALANDVQITAGLPDRATSVTSRMTDVMTTVTSEFGGGGRGGGGGAGREPAGGGREPAGGGREPAGGGDHPPKGGGPKGGKGGGGGKGGKGGH